MSNLVQEVYDVLQAEGGRMTVQRRLILETLESMSGHPSAEEIFSVARQQDETLNLSTVYRTLRWLEKMELVNAHHFHEGKHQDRYDPTQNSEHHHFLCKRCNTIIEFSSPHVEQIRKEFEEAYGANVTAASLVMFGICEQCASLQS